jgi:CheY-like chemotaxis protein
MADEAARWSPSREDAAAALQLDDGPVSDRGLARRAVGAHVLIADDNADMRDYLVRLLGQNWTVTHAGDGQEAVRLARGDPPDLILADVMMPGLDGFALVRTIRADPVLASTPIKKAIRDKSVFEMEHRVLRPDGTFGLTLSRAVPILDDDGQIIEWVGAASDVSARPPSRDASRTARPGAGPPRAELRPG